MKLDIKKKQSGVLKQTKKGFLFLLTTCMVLLLYTSSLLVLLFLRCPTLDQVYIQQQHVQKTKQKQ